MYKDINMNVLNKKNGIVDCQFNSKCALLKSNYFN